MEFLQSLASKMRNSDLFLSEDQCVQIRFHVVQDTSCCLLQPLATAIQDESALLGANPRCANGRIAFLFCLLLFGGACLAKGRALL